jgi:DNA-binding CsgD family transcriptional regulator
VREFVGGDAAPTLVLTGWPGIGKTTLWEAAVEAAQREGTRVLMARPSDAEARLVFGALIDLFDGVATPELDTLPVPQLEALEVALLRRAPTSGPPAANAVAVGLLNAIRSLAERDRLLVALDDVQWLDTASASALTFAARRLDADRVRFLLARRPGPPTALEEAVEPRGSLQLELGGLSLDGTQRLLLERLGLSLPRHVMRRIFDSTLGNPLFALEVGRTLVGQGVPAVGEELPVPAPVEELLGTRVAALPDPVRRLVAAVALSDDLRVAQVLELADVAALDAALDAGVLVVDGDHVRTSHPLLAAASVRHAELPERRALHRALADVVAEGELRTRHLALAAAHADTRLAADVAAAAGGAAARGAPQAAVELAEHALRLTPANDESRSGRLLELAGYLEVAGEKRRVTEVLEPALESFPIGVPRARAYLLLASGEIERNEDIERLFDRALAESGEDAQMRGLVLAAMAENAVGVRVERIGDAEAWALEALPDRPGAEPQRERLALYALAWARSLGGRPIDDLCARFESASPAVWYLAESPERVAGQRLVWRGEIGAAREMLLEQLRTADERGEPSSYALQRLHVCELELRAGEWGAAERRLDEWAESAERELLHWPMYERCRALLETGRGRPDEARRWASDALVRARTRGVRWDELEALRALGTAELLARRPQAAVDELRRVWEHTESEGVDDPGAFPVAPELVEALVDVGDVAGAAAVTDRLAELADAQAHPWGIAAARRSRAVIRLAETYDEAAVSDLENASRASAGLGLPFDAARALLALGRAQRRSRKWGAARETLIEAAAAFDALGSPGWADAARAELSRVGARKPSKTGELTPTEHRVSALAAQGLANKEIARELVVTVNTVEFHLSNVYAKLGIRSRSQLTRRLAETRPPAEPGD